MITLKLKEMYHSVYFKQHWSSGFAPTQYYKMIILPFVLYLNEMLSLYFKGTT